MNIIGARKDDWRADRRDVRPLYWIGGFLCAAVLCFLVAAIVGDLIVGDGSPYVAALSRGVLDSSVRFQ